MSLDYADDTFPMVSKNANKPKICIELTLLRAKGDAALSATTSAGEKPDTNQKAQGLTG